MAETLYIVDTFSLIFQVYHAIRQPMTGTRGQPTNAIFGFVGDLQHLIHDKKPTHLVCAMESAEPGERLNIYEEYKANRSSMPEDLAPQIPLILDVLGGYGIPIVSHSGWEADDVIATLATAAAARGLEVRIVSNDKDLRQLIGPKVKIYNIRKKQFLDEQHLFEEWGIRPDQVIDFQSLVGDSVDNVPGVPGVGPKTARTLIEKYGTLENILAHAAEAPGKKLAENLRDFADQARMSRELVWLRTDLPIDVDWSEACLKSPDCRKLYELFNDFGFRRYANEMHSQLVLSGQTLEPPAAAPAALPETVSGPAPGRQQQLLFAPPPEENERKWTVIDTPAELEGFLVELLEQPVVCIDLETTDRDPIQADIVGWAVSWKPGEAFYLPVDGPPGSRLLNPGDVANAMKPILEDANRTIINQNIKYDWLVLRRLGIEIQNPGLDPMIGDYLLDAGARSHGQDELARRHLFLQMIPITDLIGKGKQQIRMNEVAVDRVAEYASEDADIALRLANTIEKKLKAEQLWELYWTLERPLIRVLAEMEWNGIRVDAEELKRQSDDVTERLKQLVTEIHALAQQEFNIDSPKQLAKVLFDDLKLPVQKRTKTGPSTDQDVLERLAALHELPKLLIEHRMLSKLKGTYLDALPQLINPSTGNLHTSFSQVTASTGRLSSSNPNLQNIPVRTIEGSRIRRAFIPSRPGWKLVCLDYSQIELRMLAHFCQDEALRTAFREGEDIHAAVASQVYGVSLDSVTSAQRRVAKAVNFGVIYGQSAFGLAATLGIDKDEAAKFIDDYFKKYSSVQHFIELTLNETRRTGFARTILGRRREISGIRPRPFGNLNLPERTAVNAVIQGSAADLIKKAMINVFHRLQHEQHPARMLLQIHDELIFETPEDHVNSLVDLAREEMAGALDLSIPIVVDCKIGTNWLDAEAP
jgi:DNA polymerase-1